MRDHRLVDRSRKHSHECVCSTEVLTLRLLPGQGFSPEPPSSVVKQHQHPTVCTTEGVPSVLGKVYLVYCDLCNPCGYASGNWRTANEELALQANLLSLHCR
jgi:hypothetical protein